MPHVKNLNLPEYMFALQFLHAIGDNAKTAKNERIEHNP